MTDIKIPAGKYCNECKFLNIDNEWDCQNCNLFDDFLVLQNGSNWDDYEKILKCEKCLQSDDIKIIFNKKTPDFESRFKYTVPRDGILKINGTQQSGELVTKYGRYKLSNIVGVGIQVEKDDVIVVDKTLVTSIEME